MPKKTTKKSVTKKVAATKAVKKAAPVKAPAKKVATKKAAAKKVAAKKVAAKKVAAPKAPAKKTAAAKTTTITARVDVGFGNDLYIRGEGAGLSWDKGSLMENASPYEWTFSTSKAKGETVFKFLINDEIWAEGENMTVAVGEESASTPTFIW